MLDHSPLQKALTSLKRAILRSKTDPKDEEVRDAVIQRFEYSYELCWKMLKRHLSLKAASPSTIDSFSFKELFREGAQQGLVEDPEKWFEYRRHRNITAHTYDDLKAKAVYDAACHFLPDAEQLLKNLQDTIV